MEDLRIEPEETRALTDVIYIDARNPQAWGEAKTKIAGAIRIPANALASHIDELPKRKEFVAYCT